MSSQIRASESGGDRRHPRRLRPRAAAVAAEAAAAEVAAEVAAVEAAAEVVEVAAAAATTSFP